MYSYTTVPSRRIESLMLAALDVIVSARDEGDEAEAKSLIQVDRALEGEKF